MQLMNSADIENDTLRRECIANGTKQVKLLATGKHDDIVAKLFDVNGYMALATPDECIWEHGNIPAFLDELDEFGIDLEKVDYANVTVEKQPRKWWRF